MATGKEIETRGHIAGFQEEISKVAGQGKEEFFTWFDSVSNTDMAFIRGNWDFLYHIALPIAQYIKNPEDKSVLDIGYGGGRMLTSACSFFKNGIGIDIHDQVELVAAEMKTRGVLNFSLMQTDGKNIPIQEKHIDLVYSFIVLMHVEKIEIFKSYFFETYRVLKPGGVAILYFARQYSLSNNKKSKLIYWYDRIRESFEYRILRRQGYEETPARVNDRNLLVALPFAIDLARSAGFQILGKIVSHKKVPDRIGVYGRQHGLILRKRE